LAFTQTLNYELSKLGDNGSQKVSFEVNPFLKFQNPNLKNKKNYYQMKELLNFFSELQPNSLIQYFSG
jgi:hypothetical protein